MQPLKGAAVGAGYFSQFHFDAWQRIEGVELVALCETDERRRTTTESKYRIPRSYDNFEEMLERERPDFVDIITRPESHLDLVNAAAERGIAVICQKPLAPSFTEACQLVEAARAADVPLMVHENFRFQPWHREVKRLLREGRIGERLQSLSCRTRLGDGWQTDAYLNRQPYFRQMPQFLIFETGVHFIDTYRYLFGEIDSVYARLARHNRDIRGEDAAMVMFEFEGGALGLWDANRFNESNAEDSRYTFGEFLIEGDAGSIRLYADGRLTLQPLGSHETEHAYTHQRRGFAGDCVFATQKHFVDCLRQGVSFETDGTEYLKTLSVQEAIYQSAESGQPVRGLTQGNTHASH